MRTELLAESVSSLSIASNTKQNLVVQLNETSFKFTKDTRDKPNTVVPCELRSCLHLDSNL